MKPFWEWKRDIRQLEAPTVRAPSEYHAAYGQYVKRFRGTETEPVNNNASGASGVEDEAASG